MLRHTIIFGVAGKKKDTHSVSPDQSLNVRMMFSELETFATLCYCYNFTPKTPG